MTKRLSKKYKLLKFYQEDLWGKLALSLTFKKIKINRLFHEIFQERNLFRSELEKERERLRKKFRIDEPTSSDQQRRKRNVLFRTAFQEFMKNLRRIHFRAAFNFRVDKGKPKRKVRRLTRFARRLKNRHKLRKFSTQSMNVRQLRSYVRKARVANGVFLRFFKLLETRVDTLAFRLNLVSSAGEARQLVNHKNFIVNGRNISFPTESIEMFDVFSVQNKEFFYERSLGLFKKGFIVYSLPVYLEVNLRIMSAVIFMWPTASTVSYVRKIDARLLAAASYKIR
jgi:small subunit ribosomal protein S4